MAAGFVLIKKYSLGPTDSSLRREPKQEFYAEKGFVNEPQRCKACRDARKNATRGEREWFEATCDSCGGVAKVPFKPREDRPVYCSECFAKMREQG